VVLISSGLKSEKGLNSVTRIQSNEILGLLKGGLNIQRFW